MVYIVPSNRVYDASREVTKIEKKKEENIYNSLKFFMVFSQILGILPQENILTYSNEVKFTWRSWKVFYTLVVISLTTFALLTCGLAWFSTGYVFTALATHIFYAGAFLTLTLYLRLARSWQKLISSWCRMDKIMNCTYGYPNGLDKRLRLFFAVFLSLGIADYFLGVWNRYTNMSVKWGENYNYHKFYYETFPQLFEIIPINILTGMYASALTVHATLTWAFNDLFIILMSIALALRFRQITEKISKNYKKINTEKFWAGIREDYDRLSMLCKELDDHISYIVLLSYSLNMFFLVVQLYHSLETVSELAGKIYFFYSFFYLIFKVISVSLYAAWINDESLKPTGSLNSVSSEVYNNEIKRLLLQISFDNIALTGCRMFKVTRGIILSIAGAIVTYELVLIQFNAATEAQL